MHLSRVVQCFDVICEYKAQSTCVIEGGVAGTLEGGYGVSQNCACTIVLNGFLSVSSLEYLVT